MFFTIKNKLHSGFSIASTNEFPHIPLLFVFYHSSVETLSFHTENGKPSVIQHPQLLFQASIAQPNVKKVFATDVSSTSSAFLMVVGSSSARSSQSLINEQLAPSSIVMFSRV
jgi:hypothetical protein